MHIVPEMHTVPEVAVRLHICEKGVWRRLRKGALPRVKIGRCTRVPRAAVDDYIARGGA